jgi:hypothetical protein
MHMKTYTHAPAVLPRKNVQYRLNNILGGPQGRSGLFCAGNRNFLCSSTRFSHFTYWDIPNPWIVSESYLVLLGHSSTLTIRHMYCPLTLQGHYWNVFQELRITTFSVVMSVCPNGTTRLPLDGFPWNLIFACFRNSDWENCSTVKMWQEWRALYVKTDIRFWSCLHISFGSC